MSVGFAHERFELIRHLGSGGFGDVYAARDRSTDAVVALKILRHAGPSELLRFKREFRRVAQVVHPNLVRLYELIQQDERWFFTMELIPGIHLLDHLRNRRIERRDTIVRTFTQIVTALQKLHDEGIVHRDVKPSNILVTGDERVVLLDFGIAKEMSAETLPSTLIGSPLYIAPECMRGSSAQASADWYSVGVILYEVLTGQHPFIGDWIDVLVAKHDRDPIHPAEIGPTVDADLCALSMALLERDPDKRPAAAEIMRTLTRDLPPSGAGVARAAHPRPPFVARAAQMEALSQALEVTLRGRPAVVHITGPSGIGKTALVQRFLEEARESSGSCAILVGACHQEETVAFNALDEFVDHLTDYLVALPPSDLAFVLPPRSHLIGRIFPVFKRAPSQPTADDLEDSEIADPVEIRRLGFAALKNLMARLCERVPVIAVIDDVQWADRDSGLFLDELCRGPDAPPLLLILTYRREASAQNPIVDSLRTTHAGQAHVQFKAIDLAGLEADEARTLVRELLARQDTPATADDITRIASEADGSPFFVHRLVEHVRSMPERLAEVRSHTIIGETMAALTPTHRLLVELIAVAGRPLPLAVCIHAVRDGDGAVDLGRLFAARMLQKQGRGDEALLDIYHDRIREHILRTLSASEMVAHHKALVDSFVAVHPTDEDSLVHHCERAGLTADAATHAVAAGSQASRALAFERAVAMYRRALDLGVWEPAERRDITIALARALSNAGRGPEAARFFAQAAGSGSRIEDVRLRINAADQYLRTGHLADGDRLLQQAMADVGLSVSHRTLPLIVSTLFHRARAGRLLKRIDESRPAATDEWQVARLEVLWAATIGLALLDPIRSAHFSARHLYYSLSQGDEFRLALALASEATYLSHRDAGRDGRARRFLETALRYAARSGAPYATAFVYCMSGFVAGLGSRWNESVVESEKALALFRERCTGVSLEVATAVTFLCTALIMKGDFVRQGRVLSSFVADASVRGDLLAAEIVPALAMCWLPDLLADDPVAAANRLPALPADSPATWRIEEASALAGMVDILLYQQQPARAWTLMEGHWKSVSSSLLMRLMTIKMLMLLSRMRCAVALAASQDTDTDTRRMLLTEAERVAHIVERSTSGHGAALAQAGLAGVQSVRGPVPEALRLLHVVSGDLLAFELMPWYHAARWHLSQQDTGQPGRPATPDAWWTTQRVANPARFALLAVPGRWR
jgi:hypothetical protein